MAMRLHVEQFDTNSNISNRLIGAVQALKRLAEMPEQWSIRQVFADCIKRREAKQDCISIQVRELLDKLRQPKDRTPVELLTELLELVRSAPWVATAHFSAPDTEEEFVQCLIRIWQQPKNDKIQCLAMEGLLRTLDHWNRVKDPKVIIVTDIIFKVFWPMQPVSRRIDEVSVLRISERVMRLRGDYLLSGAGISEQLRQMLADQSNGRCDLERQAWLELVSLNAEELRLAVRILKLLNAELLRCNEIVPEIVGVQQLDDSRLLANIDMALCNDRFANLVMPLQQLQSATQCLRIVWLRLYDSWWKMRRAPNPSTAGPQGLAADIDMNKWYRLTLYLGGLGGLWLRPSGNGTAPGDADMQCTIAGFASTLASVLAVEEEKRVPYIESVICSEAMSPTLVRRFVDTLEPKEWTDRVAPRFVKVLNGILRVPQNLAALEGCDVGRLVLLSVKKAEECASMPQLRLRVCALLRQTYLIHCDAAKKKCCSVSRAIRELNDIVQKLVNWIDPRDGQNRSSNPQADVLTVTCLGTLAMLLENLRIVNTGALMDASSNDVNSEAAQQQQLQTAVERVVRCMCDLINTADRSIERLDCRHIPLESIAAMCDAALSPDDISTDGPEMTVSRSMPPSMNLPAKEARVYFARQALVNVVRANVEDGLGFLVDLAYHPNLLGRAVYLDALTLLLSGQFAHLSRDEHLDSLMSLIFEHDPSHRVVLHELTSGRPNPTVLNAIIRTFLHRGKLLSLIGAIFESLRGKEMRAVLLRDSSVLPNVVSTCFRMLGEGYLKETIAPLLRWIEKTPKLVMEDPNSSQFAGSQSALNAREILSRLMDRLMRTVDKLPLQLRTLCHSIAARMCDQQERTRAVTTMFFLRFLTPAIMDPIQQQVMPPNWSPNGMVMQTYRHVSKVLQKFVILPSTTASDNSTRLSQWFATNQQQLERFCELLITLPPGDLRAALVHPSTKEDLQRDRRILHALLYERGRAQGAEMADQPPIASMPVEQMDVATKERFHLCYIGPPPKDALYADHSAFDQMAINGLPALFRGPFKDDMPVVYYVPRFYEPAKDIHFAYAFYLALTECAARKTHILVDCTLARCQHIPVEFYAKMLFGFVKAYTEQDIGCLYVLNPNSCFRELYNEFIASANLRSIQFLSGYDQLRSYIPLGNNDDNALFEAAKQADKECATAYEMDSVEFHVPHLMRKTKKKGVRVLHSTMFIVQYTGQLANQSVRFSEFYKLTDLRSVEVEHGERPRLRVTFVSEKLAGPGCSDEYYVLVTGDPARVQQIHSRLSKDLSTRVDPNATDRHSGCRTISRERIAGVLMSAALANMAVPYSSRVCISAFRLLTSVVERYCSDSRLKLDTRYMCVPRYTVESVQAISGYLANLHGPALVLPLLGELVTSFPRLQPGERECYLCVIEPWMANFAAALLTIGDTEADWKTEAYDIYRGLVKLFLKNIEVRMLRPAHARTPRLTQADGRALWPTRHLRQLQRAFHNSVWTPLGRHLAQYSRDIDTSAMLAQSGRQRSSLSYVLEEMNRSVVNDSVQHQYYAAHAVCSLATAGSCMNVMRDLCVLLFSVRRPRARCSIVAILAYAAVRRRPVRSCSMHSVTTATRPPAIPCTRGRSRAAPSRSTPIGARQLCTYACCFI